MAAAQSIILLFVTALIGAYGSRPISGYLERPDCTEQELLHCSRIIELIITSNEMVLAASGGELDAMCSTLLLGIDCVEKLNCEYPVGRFDNVTEPALEIIERLCERKEGNLRDKYERYLQCISETKPKVRTCENDYQEQLKDAVDANGATQIPKVCCAYRSLTNCAADAMKQFCGKSVEEFTEEFMFVAANMIVRKNCNPSESEDGGRCSQTQLTSSTVMIIGIACILLVWSRL